MACLPFGGEGELPETRNIGVYDVFLLLDRREGLEAISMTTARERRRYLAFGFGG